MTSRVKTSALVLVCGLGIAVVVGCPGGEGLPGSSGGPGGGGLGGTPAGDGGGVLAGQVSSIAGSPIPSVAVKLADGRSSSTDANGFYSFDGLDAGSRLVVQFSAPGFASTSKAFTVVTGSTATPACVLMVEATPSVMINASETTEQRSGDSMVTIEAGSLIDTDGNAVSGQVELTTTFIDPSTSSVMAFPGSFDAALSSGDENVTLESFGFAVYELMQDGGRVDLAPGQTARIEYVLPENAQSKFNMGDMIPLWEFDDDSAMWLEAGEGEVRTASDGSGRLAWFATVDHFSAWNCDAPVEDKNCVSGRVLFDASPVAGATISAVGVTYNGTSTAQSGSDGSFCVEVKRGSTVRIEIRINGAAVPISVQEIAVADVATDCAMGGCTSIGDVAVDLDSCVAGRVLNDDGSPAAGVRVHAVPGETVFTNSDGSYCAATVSDADVFVFVEGRPSVSVRTPPAADCGVDSCAQADLLLTLPGAGDVVGSLSATSTMSVDDLFGGTFFSLSGVFFLFDTDALNDLDSATADIFGSGTNTEEFGACTVATQMIDNVTGDDGVVGALGGFGALDPGDPGTADNGTATVELLRGSATSVDSTVPLLAGIFAPSESSEELMSLGFVAGATVRFSFPGGTDIGSFEAEVMVPADLVVTSPDLTDSNYSPDPGAPLNLAWVAGDPADTVFVTLSASNFSFDGGAATGSAVVILCEFPDSGSGTIPLEAMSRLPADALSTVLTVSRHRQSEVSVPLLRVVGNGIVSVVGSVSVSRTFASFLDLPDIPSIPDVGDIDICDFLDCADGEICDPNTFSCVPQ